MTNPPSDIISRKLSNATVYTARFGTGFPLGYSAMPILHASIDRKERLHLEYTDVELVFTLFEGICANDPISS